MTVPAPSGPPSADPGAAQATAGTAAAEVAAVRAGDGGARRVLYPILLRELTVLRGRRVGAALLRLTLGGPGLPGLISHCPDEHVRLVFPGHDGVLRLPEPDGDELRWPRPRAVTRDYSLRRFDPDAGEYGELDLDVVLHDGGLASGWARAATPGDRIHAAGPPDGLAVPDRFDRLLLAGDLTALPTMTRWVERLGPGTEARVVVEVDGATGRSGELDELETAAARAGATVLSADRRADGPDALARAVAALPTGPDGRLFAWAAGEAGTVKPLRRMLRDRFGLGPGEHDVTGYWKRGVAEFDDHDHGQHDRGQHDHGRHDHEH
ncbi:siderophore-interacting protein [Pseudonocardia tropica]|uniref:Siderophore-interacting protein n=1 Tax=Pseudonocardia tropica TaxID=681289 RepID=A0ABV1JYU0_9PSEU